MAFRARPARARVKFRYLKTKSSAKRSSRQEISAPLRALGFCFSSRSPQTQVETTARRRRAR